MRSNRVRSIVVFVCTCAMAGGGLVRCVGDDPSPTPDNGATDGSTSDTAPGQPGADGGLPAEGFTLSLTPGHVTEDPNDTVAVTIGVNRAVNFTDAVTFTLTTPPGVTATQPAPAGASSLFYVTAPADAGTADLTIVVTGTNGSRVETASLGVHLGSLLPVGDGGVVEIPSFATAVDVKMWGAGGGAGTGCQGHPDSGAPGGGGGFASARVPVSGGSYVAFVGTGGGYSSSNCGPGGGGGGYTAFAGPDGGMLLVAGGGGGASSVGQYAAVYDYGGPGGAGGGAQGGAGGGSCAGFGGTLSDGGGIGNCGGGNGSYLQGANAPSKSTVGGVPGGGSGGGTTPTFGNGAPGGGGGGYFGGGSGGIYSGSACPPNGACFSGGGGGGCGFNPFDGGVLAGATGATPPNMNDPDYVAGTGAGGVHAAGGPGRILIRLPKP